MPQFADSSYGAVLDKGTMDAMACGEHAVADIHDLLTESSRQVSDAQLLQHLTRLLTNCTIGTYICRVLQISFRTHHAGS